jgi:flagella basal body P-ring formation protein FlgA
MIKLKRNGIKKSNRLQLKNSQKIYMILGLVTSLIASLALYINAERAGKRQEVWVTTTTIAAGQIIDKQSVELIRADLGQISMNYLDNKSEVIGKSALEPLAAGNLLKSESIGIKSNLRNVALRISNGHLPHL